MTGLLPAFWPIDGLDFDTVKRLNFVIIVIGLGLLASRELLLRSRFRVGYFSALTLLAVFSVTNYSNYFSFHGERTFVHLHDLAHYYLGSKYHRELGYGHLYTAMLRAEAEIYGDRFRALEARDLATNRLVDIRELLSRSDQTKDRFEPSRWVDFKTDVEYFHQALGPHWAGVLKDHGYNPTPVWTLIGTALANRVPAGSRLGILTLTLLDPLLLLLVFVALGRTFGKEVALWSLIYFCVIFGATFGWIGGAYLRFLWFASLTCGFCALRARRVGLAGVLLALAAALRVFPVFFVVPLFLKSLSGVVRRQRLPLGHGRFWIGFATLALLAFGCTLFLPQEAGSWLQFRKRIETQLDTVSPNVVGLTQILTFQDETHLVTAQEFENLRQRKIATHRAQLLIVLPLFVLLVAGACHLMTDVEALVLGIPLLLVALNLAGYYFIFLLLMPLAHRDWCSTLPTLLAAEAVPYMVLLVGGREALQFVSWSLALLIAMAVLYAPQVKSVLQQFDGWSQRAFRARPS